MENKDKRPALKKGEMPNSFRQANKSNSFSRANKSLLDEAITSELNPELKLIKYSADKILNKNTKSTSKNKSKIITLTAFMVLGLFLILLIVLLPSSLVVTQVSNVILDKFNYQDVSLEERSNQLMKEKIDNLSTDKVSKYRRVNDYLTFSSTLTNSLEQEGFQIAEDKFSYNNETLSGDDYIREVNSASELSKSKDTALNIRRLAFQDDVWQRATSYININQNGYPSDAKNTEDFEKVETEYYGSQSNYRFDTNGSNDSNTILSQSLSEMNQTATELSDSKKASANQPFDNFATTSADVIAEGGICGLYQNSLFLQEYNQTRRSDQSMQAASLLLSVGEKIKAGDATQEEVKYIADKLTLSQSYDLPNGNTITTDPGTDSVGYKYASGIGIDDLDYSAEKYVNGANPTTAKITKLLDKSFSTLGGAIAKSLCGEVEEESFFSGFFSKLANFLTGFNLSDNQELISLLNYENSRLITENTLDSMTGHNLAPNIAGEDFVNAAVSGGGKLFGTVALARGNNILPKDKAIAYISRQNELIAKRAKIDQQSRSPFDIHSQNTFIGSLISKNIGLINKTDTISSTLANIINATKKQLASLTPLSKAQSQIDLMNSLSMCEDTQKQALGDSLGLDMMCNYVLGVDPAYINTPSEEVIDKLVARGDLVVASETCDSNGLNCELEEAGDLLKYRHECTERGKISPGLSDETNQIENGSFCLGDSEEKALYAIYLIDLSLQNLFDNRDKYITTKIDLASPNSGNWPVVGYKEISSGFGPRLDPFTGAPTFHSGIDIPAPLGTPIVATFDGIIKTTNPDNKCGIGTFIDFINSSSTGAALYCHLSKLNVKTGDLVRKGQIIGEIGSTGYSTGPHLHFEIIINKINIDPLLIIN